MASSSLQNTLSLHSSSHQLGFQKLGHAPHSTRRAVSTFLAKAGHADTAASCRRARQDVEAMLFASDCSIVKKFLKPEKFSIVFNSTKRSKRLKLPFEIDRTLSASQTISSASNATRTIDLEGSCDTRQSLLCYNHATIIHMLTHEKLPPFRCLIVAFSVTNAFMLNMPFEALAETCQSDDSLFNMPILLGVALIGATVGGLLARQRRGELARLNEQLRQINAALRRQAKIESYAPALSYAPVGSRIPENEVIVDPRKEELISHLKAGKNYLRNQDPAKAFEEFKASLEIAQQLKDPIEEKKAARGLGASLQRQDKYREAIKYHSMVLAISERVGEDSGNTEAYGAIADCYTELGDLERAGEFYDRYIARLEKD